MMKILSFNRKKPLKVFLLFLIFIPFSIQAQLVKRQCISSYGTSSTSSKSTLIQTVGQPFNTDGLSENSTTIFQGFQQPITIRVEQMESKPFRDLKLSIYPNPATSSVIIQSDEIIENSIIRVTDLAGKVIMTYNANQLQVYTISCETWARGIYIITVSDNHQSINSSKLIISK